MSSLINRPTVGHIVMLLSIYRAFTMERTIESNRTGKQHLKSIYTFYRRIIV